MILAGTYLARCPEHGERAFQRCNPCEWWYCPEKTCWSVIPDEDMDRKVSRWASDEPRIHCKEWAG